MFIIIQSSNNTKSAQDYQLNGIIILRMPDGRPPKRTSRRVRIEREGVRKANGGRKVQTA